MSFYVDVILPLPLYGTFTYEVEGEIFKKISVGCRVVVPFGKHKTYTGLVLEKKEQLENIKASDVRPIVVVLDKEPTVCACQIRLWQWMANYYICSLGEVYKNALPYGLKLDSDAYIIINKDVKKQELSSPLETKAFLILQALEKHGILSVREIEKSVGDTKLFESLKYLIKRQFIKIDETNNQRYRPKLKNIVFLNPELKNDEMALANIFEQLKKAPKQKALFTHFFSSEEYLTHGVSSSKLLSLSGSHAGALQALVSKEIFQISTKVVDRIDIYAGVQNQLNELSVEQRQAHQEIKSGFKAKKTVLLQGVTASGKTEIYLHLLKEMLDQDKQSLYLIPEIALSTQLIKRIQRYFGTKVQVYHSKLSDAERAELWFKCLNNKVKIILGPRSSLFLPLVNLGLIIVDEEHDTSFKQSDTAPRFHARDVALVWAKQQNANVLLGSATPSLESYYNAIENKYKFVSLKNRHSGVQMPIIRTIDLKQEENTPLIQGFFSPRLVESIKKTLENGLQIIVFQNRRGFSPYLSCRDCGYTIMCPNCDISLTYHKQRAVLSCHYCGYTRSIPKNCLCCGSTNIQPRKIGTERIEESLQTLFPKYKTARMDLDTTRGRFAFEKIISDFENQTISILVGTQMLTKGLDFKNVGLVAVIDADTLLYYPHFRSYEHAFQLLTQVAGRSGRAEKQGHVILQTQNPHNFVLEKVIKNDLTSFYKQTLEDRKRYNYPPYTRLVEFCLSHKNQNKVKDAAKNLSEQLHSVFPKNWILGPKAAIIEKVRNEYRQELLFKIPKDISINELRKKLLEIINLWRSLPKQASIKIIYDVDP